MRAFLVQLWEWRCPGTRYTSRKGFAADLFREGVPAGCGGASPSRHYNNANADSDAPKSAVRRLPDDPIIPILRVFHRYLQSLQSDTTCSSSAASKFGRVAPSQHQQHQQRKRRLRRLGRRPDELPPLDSTKPRPSRKPKEGMRTRLSSSTACTSVVFTPSA